MDPSPSDADILALLRPHLPDDCRNDPSAHTTAIAYYREISALPLEHIVMLLLVQHRMIEESMRLMKKQESTKSSTKLTTVYGPNGRRMRMD